MVEIVRTNDLVTIGFLQSLLENANIPVLVADSHISALEGMIGAFPRRILVPDDHAAQARRLIAEAGLSAELRVVKG
jgi:Putative prokaryotic signal transducing protein